MKLKSLWIKDYKNLKDFHLDFEKGNGLSILIGNNGSGKSNVLEAISGIFAEFFGKPSDSFKTDYRLNYEINDKNIFLEKKNGKLIYHRDESEMKISDMAPYLPSNVIALYSGEDLRLWENFYFPKYDAYLKNVYRKGYAGKMGMYYVNKYLWNISLLVLLLFMNEFPDVKTFLHDELGIQDESSINLIEIDFSYEHYERNQNTNLKAFIDKINPEGKYVNPYSIAELRRLTSNSSDIFEAEPREVFNLLMQAFMPKSFKIISDIHIFLEKGEAIQFFSEGEKKLILIKTVLEFVADENALLLLDEPDANIHEARKSKLYNLLKNTPNREVVMTTHSPIIAKIASENELIYLESKSGSVSIIEKEKLELIRKLASDEWNIMEAGVFLNSEKPLVLFEGKSDVAYVRKAIEILRQNNDKYKRINVDILSFNGTGNAEDFFKNLKKINQNKLVIFFFDRDNGGKDGMSHISGKPKSDASIQNYQDFEDAANLLKAVFLPCRPESSNYGFMIEDYFPLERIKNTFDELINIQHPYTKVISKKFEENFKEKLEENCNMYTENDFQNFSLLLEKLVELLEIS